MENIKEVLRLLVAIFIFLSASAIVFLVIHSVSHVVGGFSLFTIAVIVVLSFFFIIMLCTYQCGDKTINSLLDRRQGADNSRFTGVSVIQVPCRYGRSVSSCSESPSDITHRIYSAGWCSPDDDSGLPPYIDDPPPDYFTATGKCPDSISCNNESTPTTGGDCSNESIPPAVSDCNDGKEKERLSSQDTSHSAAVDQ